MTQEFGDEEKQVGDVLLPMKGYITITGVRRETITTGKKKEDVEILI
jgi:hypothetical protein